MQEAQPQGPSLPTTQFRTSNSESFLPEESRMV